MNLKIENNQQLSRKYFSSVIILTTEIMKNNDIQLRNDANVRLDDELMEETRYLIFFSIK